METADPRPRDGDDKDDAKPLSLESNDDCPDGPAMADQVLSRVNFITPYCLFIFLLLPMGFFYVIFFSQSDGPYAFTFNIPPTLPPEGSYSIASSVYVLINEDRLMSADMRVMWYLKRLGTIQTIDKESNADSSEQCKIMSFIPREKDQTSNDNGNENNFFLMNSSTHVYFLTSIYNMVYCLDMSPSNCSVVRLLLLFSYFKI